MFNLKGNNYNKKEIEKWYQEEEQYHNQFEGGRSKDYWIINETFNNKYAFDKFVNFNLEAKILSFGCAEVMIWKKIIKNINSNFMV